jgi:hypothetical protein
MGEPDQLLVTARDVSDQVALRQQVTHLTFHDGLTGLPNRAYLESGRRTCSAPGRATGWPLAGQLAGPARWQRLVNGPASAPSCQ